MVSTSASGGVAGSDLLVARPTPAAVLQRVAEIHLPGADLVVEELRKVRAAADRHDDPELWAATAFPEAVWWMNRDKSAAIALLDEAITRNLGRNPAVLVTLSSLRSYVMSADTLESVDEIAASLVTLSNTDPSSPWTARAWNLLAIRFHRLGLVAHADELYLKVRQQALATSDAAMVAAADSNRLRVAIDETLWALLLDESPRERLPDPGILDMVVAPEVDGEATDTWQRNDHLEVLRAMVDPDRDLAKIRSYVGDGDGAPAGSLRATSLIVLARHALAAGDLDEAGRFVDQLEAEDNMFVRDRPHMLTWLRSQIVHAQLGEIVDDVVAHARQAWKRLDVERQVLAEAIRVRIEAQAGSAAREILEQQVFEDSLTGLGNRRRFEQTEIDADADVAVLIVDLDEFKQVNDNFGHDVGDEVLRRIGTILMSCVRSDDLVCRLGGDEIAIIATGLSPASVRERAGRIVTAVAAEPWEMVTPGLDVTVSVGAAHGRGSRTELYRHADAAMYEAKASGGSAWRMRAR